MFAVARRAVAAFEIHFEVEDAAVIEKHFASHIIPRNSRRHFKPLGELRRCGQE